ALFRPGAALNIDSYIKRKHKEEEITYLDPSLEEITKSTYGFLIYQEQIIKLANIYAGYTLGEADILRRAMSKKKLELLQKEEEKFIEKSRNNNHTYEQAKKIFDLILKFAGYGFNKSHSVAYSIVSYKMAYLKCHYKTIFYKNLLTNCIGSEEKTSEYIKEAKKNHIEIKKPTIEESGRDYIVKDNAIYYPISNIKGIGMVGSTQIEKAKEKGPFLDIYDCFSRLYIEGVGKKTLETLIYANVFSSFSYTRATLIYNLDNLVNYAELTKDIDPSLVEKPDIIEQLEFSNEFLLEKEKELFGFYLSHHPTTAYQKENPNCIYLNTIEENFNKDVDCLVLVERLKIIKTKKNEEMAFLTGSDETTTKEFILFPRVYQLNRNIEKGNIIKVRGTVEKRLNEYQIVVKKIDLLQGENHEEEK
ncbi:MAG: DNA polymerase III subunit alpha, partial [Bacilli bacterium]|nr:DNA polymerase III subunit alpha [Bacilli bacterium]